MTCPDNLPRDQFLQGHVLEVLRRIPDAVIQCCITSPPYWGLRVYAGAQDQIWLNGDKSCEEHVWREFIREGKSGGNRSTKVQIKGQENFQSVPASQHGFCVSCGAWRGALGLEPTIDLYVQHIVEIFREVKRVLRDDGLLFLNIGDSYMGGKGKSSQAWSTEHQDRETLQKSQHQICGLGETRPGDLPQDGLKPKDLAGIPWRVAFALQADGWWLRSDIIWSKKNPMPESVTDRPTRSHEYVFLLTKSARYFYDADAVREGLAESTLADSRNATGRHTQGDDLGSKYGDDSSPDWPSWYRGKVFVNPSSGRNLRSVWTLATQAFSGAHFATFSEKLVEKCLLAGSSPKACEHCGAPWARVVEKERKPTRPGKNNVLDPTGMANRDPLRHCTESRSLGFRPSCSCENNTGSGKCLVLDPFMGSGTVACVAVKHNRSFLGIDLAYQEMARKRLAAVQPEMPL